jgi:OTU domain-containing protein 6
MDFFFFKSGSGDGHQPPSSNTILKTNPPAAMEELLSKHRKEQRDLQARVTQKKKSASKKTRKGVNEECAQLETELKQRQAQEIAALNGEPGEGESATSETSEQNGVEESEEGEGEASNKIDDGLASQTANLSVKDPSTPAKKPNRQKERLARKAAEQDRLAKEAAAEAAAMPDLRAQERTAMFEGFKKRGLQEKVVRADGHCLYASIADQVRQIGQEVKIGPIEGKEEDYKLVRQVAADYISKHPDDFVPFLEEPLDSYVIKVRDTGEWGGHVELMALAKAYDLKICVLNGDGSVLEIGDGDEDKKIWLAYYKHGFGLGEHYNSLRKEKT